MSRMVGFCVVITSVLIAVLLIGFSTPGCNVSLKDPSLEDLLYCSELYTMGSSSSRGSGATMKAVVRSSEGLRYNDNYPVPRLPKPQSDEIIVRVMAAAINPVDYKVNKFILGPVAGLDVAGIVEKVGDNSLSGLKVGDKVYGTARGSLSELVLAKASSLGKIPDALSFEQAAAMPTAYITSLQGLNDADKGAIKPGAKVLIIGASGGCGSAAVQLASALGAGEIVGICSARNAEFVKAQGANRVLDYNQNNFGDKENEFDLIYDTATNSGAGEDYKAFSVERLKNEGQYVAINGSPSMWIRMFTIGQKKNQHLFLTNMNTADLDKLSALVTKSNGKVMPVISKSLPFTKDAVEQGFSMLKSRRTVGKIVFSVSTQEDKNEINLN